MAQLSLRRVIGFTIVVASALGTWGCSSGDDDSTTITVLAAASLTDVMSEIAAEFEDDADVEVDLSFGASSGLREQVLAGAPVDVFASADPENMDALIAAGEMEDPVTFTRNRLQIAVPPGNPGDVEGLADLGRDELLIGLCDPAVPCGALAQKVLATAGVDPAPDTRAADARSLLTQIASGDLDAGLVYETDVLAAGDRVSGISLSRTVDVSSDYVIATATRADDPGAARDFVDFVISPEGRRILDAAGFPPP